MVTQIEAFKADQSSAQLLVNAARSSRYVPDIAMKNLDGFIHHPAGFPIEYRRIWSPFWQGDIGQDGPGKMGLCFESDKYIKPGTTLEVSIPLRGETQVFKGKVVLVKSQADHYAIGLWLASAADTMRIRIVEQICHIEAYVMHKHYKEGPFISRERVTEEWISRFAASFPST